MTPLTGFCRLLLPIVLGMLPLMSCAAPLAPATPAPIDLQEKQAMPFRLTSSAFVEGNTIPRRFTCDGENVSPPLSWSAIPDGAASLALIVDDPDAPAGTWVHWVLFDLPADTTNLSEGLPASETLANGARQGRNDFKRVGYGGPCPPRGSTHRYFFKLYALDTKLDLRSGVTKATVEDAMTGHVLAAGQLIGRYQRG